MTLFYRNLIVGLVWTTLLFLIITAQASQMLLAALFSVLMLHFYEDVVKKYIGNSNIQKGLGFIMSGLTVGIIGFVLYKSFNVMLHDFNKMIAESQPYIISTLHGWGMEEKINTISEIYEIITAFVKENVGILTTSVGLLTKVLIGLVIGVIVHFSGLEHTREDGSAWASIMNKISEQFQEIYKSFRNIMSIQVLVSLMNTTIVSILAFVITPFFNDGSFLPYWYVIIPMTAILSLIPVVGNILINLLLVLATVQINPWFMVFGVGLFLVVHKLEFLVIGNKMKELLNINFTVILVSMILGKMLFNSMSGMILGIVILVTLSNILKKVKIIELSGVKNER